MYYQIGKNNCNSTITIISKMQSGEIHVECRHMYDLEEDTHENLERKEKVQKCNEKESHTWLKSLTIANVRKNFSFLQNRSFVKENYRTTKVSHTRLNRYQ